MATGPHFHTWITRLAVFGGVLGGALLHAPDGAEAARLKCKYNAAYANDKFVGGLPPTIVGVVTHLSKRFKELKGGSGALAKLDKGLAYYRDLNTSRIEKWDDRDRQPYHVYVAYRRVPTDKSGSTAKGSRPSLVKCRRAEHFVGDLIVIADILGTSIFRGIIESMVNAPSLHEPLEVYADFTYTLEYKTSGSGGFQEVANEFNACILGCTTKTRVQHPDNPKKQVVQALSTIDGTFPGAYGFRLTAEAAILCDGPYVVCRFATANAYTVAGWLFGLLTGGAGGLAVSVLIPVPTDMPGAFLWVAEKFQGRVVEQSLTKAVVQYDRVDVPATVPDLRGTDKCDAPEALKRRELKYRIETLIDKDRGKSQKVAESDPPPFSQVKPQTLVTLTVKTPDTKRNYPCKKSVQARMRNVNKGSGP